MWYFFVIFFFQAEDGIRDYKVTGVQTCALPISTGARGHSGQQSHGSAGSAHGDDAHVVDRRVAARLSPPGGGQPLLPAPERRPDAALARPDAGAGSGRSGRVPPQRNPEITLRQRAVELLGGTADRTHRHAHAAALGRRRPPVQRRPHEARSRQPHPRAPPRDDLGATGVRGPAARCPRRRRHGQCHRAGGADVAEGCKLSTDLVILSTRVVTQDGIAPAAVAVTDGVITAVHEHGGGPDAARRLDVGDAALLPGAVDAHVHVNEPGRTEWEGFETATRAAAAGGVTTIVDMPLNSIPVTTTTPALEQKARAAAGRATVDYAFWGGVVPGNTDQLAALARSGVRGFKCFLVPSGIDEFPPVGEAQLRPAMTKLAGLGLPLLVHAELPGTIARAAPSRDSDPRRDRKSTRLNSSHLVISYDVLC